MPVQVKDELIPRSLMLLCLGTAVSLAVIQWSGLIPRSSRQPVGIVRADHKSVAVTTSPSPPPIASPQPVSTTVPESGTRLVVKLSDRHVYLYKDDKILNQYPLAVGQDGWETPPGPHRILDKEQNPAWIHPITGVESPPGPDNPLGKAWIGFWTDGKTEIGFHGTNQEELIGQAVSHGCLRMRNEDIEDLYAQVDVGTPVIVEP
jgi:lipoprotein-anchoring transpeptidase ErfK/SrfK